MPEDADYCAEWFQGAENLASASFELPAVADLLFFLSRGPVSGHIDVIQTPNYSRGPIEVNVTAQYHHGEDLERTKLCRIGAANEHGVLIWVRILLLFEKPKLNLTRLNPGIRMATPDKTSAST
jgi:hypothetical protein